MKQIHVMICLMKFFYLMNQKFSYKFEKFMRQIHETHKQIHHTKFHSWDSVSWINWKQMWTNSWDTFMRRNKVDHHLTRCLVRRMNFFHRMNQAILWAQRRMNQFHRMYFFTWTSSHAFNIAWIHRMNFIAWMKILECNIFHAMNSCDEKLITPK